MKLGSDCGNTFPKKPWSVHVCRAARLRCPGGQGQGQPNDFLRLDVVAGLVALRLEWESPGLAVGRQKVCLAACVHAWVGLLLVAQSVVPARVRRLGEFCIAASAQVATTFELTALPHPAPSLVKKHCTWYSALLCWVTQPSVQWRFGARSSVHGTFTGCGRGRKEECLLVVWLVPQ